MSYSIHTKRFAKHLVIAYKQFDKDEKKYFIDVNLIANFDIDHLVSLIMIDEPEKAKEANSADNDAFSEMINSVINYMENSTYDVRRYKFLESWTRGVRDYFSDEISGLLNNSLEELQCE